MGFGDNMREPDGGQEKVSWQKKVENERGTTSLYVKTPQPPTNIAGSTPGAPFNNHRARD